MLSPNPRMVFYLGHSSWGHSTGWPRWPFLPNTVFWGLHSEATVFWFLWKSTFLSFSNYVTFFFLLAICRILFEVPSAILAKCNFSPIKPSENRLPQQLLLWSPLTSVLLIQPSIPHLHLNWPSVALSTDGYFFLHKTCSFHATWTVSSLYLCFLFISLLPPHLLTLGDLT